MRIVKGTLKVVRATSEGAVSGNVRIVWTDAEDGQLVNVLKDL